MVNEMLVFMDSDRMEMFDETLSLLLKSGFEYSFHFTDTSPELFEQRDIKEPPTLIILDSCGDETYRLEGFDLYLLGLALDCSY